MHTEEKQSHLLKLDLKNLTVWELNTIIRERQELRKEAWQEFSKRKPQSIREYNFLFNQLVSYMEFPEIRESVWRAFLNIEKTNGLVFSHLSVTAYSSVSGFRTRIASRKMKHTEIENVGERLLCLIFGDFPKFEEKVKKELMRRFFRDSKLLSTGKFHLITIVRCNDYSTKLKLWAADILLTEKLNIRDLNYIYTNLPELKK